jgi:hypothetical protein
VADGGGAAAEPQRQEGQHVSGDGNERHSHGYEAGVLSTAAGLFSPRGLCSGVMGTPRGEQNSHVVVERMRALTPAGQYPSAA